MLCLRLSIVSLSPEIITLFETTCKKGQCKRLPTSNVKASILLRLANQLAIGVQEWQLSG